MNTGCTTSQVTRPKGIIGTVSLMDTESSLTRTAGRHVRRCRRENERAKRAYKPGSVADGHLSWHARHRAAPRTLPGRGPGRPIAPLFALAPDGVYQAAALPRRWWSLTPPFQLFPLRAESARRWESSFLRHFPSGCPAWPLASILPCGARTFLTPVPERRSRDRLARFARGIVASGAGYGAQASNPHEASDPSNAKFPLSLRNFLCPDFSLSPGFSR